MDPMGFVVSCTSDKRKVKQYDCKVYAVIKLKNGKIRFRYYNKFGAFSTYEQAQTISKEYAVDRGWPYCPYLKHNRIVPSLIYSWYFKDPPVKPI